MLLAIDIGNTNVKLAVMKGRRVLGDYVIENNALQAGLDKTLNRIKKDFPHLRRAILCSVVPNRLKTVERAIKKSLTIQPAVVGRDVQVPIRNNYRNPKQVGQDRLVCAYAALEIYGRPAVVIDLGTAITFDAISRSGAYEGGMIVPGIQMSSESLFQNTALLPRVSLYKSPRVLIGKNTQESILSGIFYGYGTMCCGLIDQLSKELSGKPKVIVTGGHTHLMRKFIQKKITKIDPYLVFKGMALLAARHYDQ